MRTDHHFGTIMALPDASRNWDTIAQQASRQRVRDGMTVGTDVTRPRNGTRIFSDRGEVSTSGHWSVASGTRQRTFYQAAFSNAIIARVSRRTCGPTFAKGLEFWVSASSDRAKSVLGQPLSAICATRTLCICGPHAASLADIKRAKGLYSSTTCARQVAGRPGPGLRRASARST